MKHLLFAVTIFVLFSFFFGLYVYSSGKLDTLFSGMTAKREGMENENVPNQPPNLGANCPDMLIRQGNELLLYNSRIPVIKGMNPLTFSNLDEYIAFVRNERQKGNDCPVLFLQHETDIQGKDVYRARPNIFDLQPGLQTQSAAQMAQNPAPVIDSNTDHPPYNAGQYAGFDPMGLSVGVYTTLDQVHESTSKSPLSDNPMDPNWGGVLYTQKQIQSGKYDENAVYKPNLLTVRNTQFNPGQFGHESPPNQLITVPH
jgi:hypothetical protein